MKIQVLVATMDQENHALLEKMHLETDAIVANQCNYNSIEKFEWKGHQITYLNFSERGVGLNRNNALMRAKADICLFADDDMIYEKDYVQTVLRAFKRNPNADVIIFNLHASDRKRHITKKQYRVHFWSCSRFGCARIAVKLKSIRDKGIYFNQCFGGGTEHCHGEDYIFLAECLKKNLVIYAVPDYIANLTEERNSTWFTGFNEKYFRDQGELFKVAAPKIWKLMCLQDAIRHKKIYKRPFWTTYKLMCNNKPSLTPKKF